jgi:hypothetical protein
MPKLAKTKARAWREQTSKFSYAAHRRVPKAIFKLLRPPKLRDFLSRIADQWTQMKFDSEQID